MRINLKKLIEDRDLDRAQLAKVLFPDNLHPSVALTRCLSESTALKEEQIFRLSMFTNLSIDALYEESIQWKNRAQGGLVRFTRDEYTAVFSPETGITKIYHLESLMATHTISRGLTPLSEYLEEINNVIINKSIKQ